MTIGSDVLSLAGKRALVVGGSSGIGNGIAQLFRSQGAAVRVWGTRASAADYAGEKGIGPDRPGIRAGRRPTRRRSTALSPPAST